MTTKILVFAASLLLMAAGAYWAYSMIEENAKLNVELDSALGVNEQVAADNKYLLGEINRRDTDLLAREQYINELSATTADIREELADAKTKLSDEELVCLTADIPVPYREQLRQRSSTDEHEDGENLPVISVSTGIPVQ